MDYRAGVIESSATSHGAQPVTVRAEQAIFTSIRTPLGEGYRLVAMSPGITGEERAEITRRSPSHASVCDPDPGACALSSYPLASQRHCVAWTRYAGREHTARGGQRVHTHLSVLDRDGFMAMSCDPFRVHAAMRDVLGDEPCLKPATCLECLELDVPAPCAWAGQSNDRREWERPCGVAFELLERGAMLVVGSASPLALMRGALAVLPLAFRVDLSVSANLQYASARQIRVTCVGQNTPELQRSIAGQDVHVLDLNTQGPAPVGGYWDWFRFVLERADQGRLAETLVLADQLDGQVDPATLARIITVCRDADRVEDAGQELLEELVTGYADWRPCHPAEGRLVRQLLSAAVRRAAALQHQELACATATP